MNKDSGAIITEHKIGAMTYLVAASHSENAKDTIQTKIEKLIIKNINANSESNIQLSDLK